MKSLRDLPVQRLCIYLCIVIFFALTAISCSRDKSDKKRMGAQDAQTKLITAYFSTPIVSKGEMDGFWVADKDDFAAMVEKRFLSSYVPAPGELSSADIRKNIRDSRYFLRIDGSQCDELFLIVGGHAIAHPGESRAHPSKKDTYRVIFTSIDAKDRTQIKTAAEVQFNRAENFLLLDMGGKPIRLGREKRNAETLVKEFAKPALATELPQY